MNVFKYITPAKTEGRVHTSLTSFVKQRSLKKGGERVLLAVGFILIFVMVKCHVIWCTAALHIRRRLTRRAGPTMGSSSSTTWAAGATLLSSPSPRRDPSTPSPGAPPGTRSVENLQFWYYGIQGFKFRYRIYIRSYISPLVWYADTGNYFPQRYELQCTFFGHFSIFFPFNRYILPFSSTCLSFPCPPFHIFVPQIMGLLADISF